MWACASRPESGTSLDARAAAISSRYLSNWGCETLPAPLPVRSGCLFHAAHFCLLVRQLFRGANRSGMGAGLDLRFLYLPSRCRVGFRGAFYQAFLGPHADEQTIGCVSSGVRWPAQPRRGELNSGLTHPGQNERGLLYQKTRDERRRFDRTRLCQARQSLKIPEAPRVRREGHTFGPRKAARSRLCSPSSRPGSSPPSVSGST